jgi:hypothetical protein
MKKYIYILVDERLELVGIRDMTHTCAIVAMCWAGMQVTVRKTVYKHWMWKWRRNILPPLWPTANCSPPPPAFSWPHRLQVWPECWMYSFYFPMHAKYDIPWPTFQSSCSISNPHAIRDCWSILPVSTCHSSRRLPISTNTLIFGMRLSYHCL